MGLGHALPEQAGVSIITSKRAPELFSLLTEGLLDFNDIKALFAYAAEGGLGHRGRDALIGDLSNY